MYPYTSFFSLYSLISDKQCQATPWQMAKLSLSSTLSGQCSCFDWATHCTGHVLAWKPDKQTNQKWVSIQEKTSKYLFDFVFPSDCSGQNPSPTITSIAMVKHCWGTSQSRQPSASMMSLTVRKMRRNRMTGKMRKMTTTMTRKSASNLRDSFAIITELCLNFNKYT